MEVPLSEVAAVVASEVEASVAALAEDVQEAVEPDQGSKSEEGRGKP